MISKHKPKSRNQIAAMAIRDTCEESFVLENDDEQNSGGRVTLSGLLNFTDGLWSCCGDERHGTAALRTHGRPLDWGGVLTPTQIGEIPLRNRMDADVAMKEVVLAMQARINLGVGGGSRDQLAELDSSCDDQTMKMRLSLDKVADNIYFLDKVATLLKAAKIKTVRIYNANHSVLKAFSGTSIRRGRLAAR
ncbi:hypothetical protein PS1_023193 [Malus domestica]